MTNKTKTRLTIIKVETTMLATTITTNMTILSCEILSGYRYFNDDDDDGDDGNHSDDDTNETITIITRTTLANKQKFNFKNNNHNYY